ncbi:hypothetical protein [Stieleria varia]|uniref:Uncharacterized protein n=1 Tax=Stieleria varia TaxID=2528005 RepID=A0A5C6ATH5_9BACT|nr:hypothetical protein [Stieleria varia]TWU02366.1 hypothetical protein Pla52n_34160 [Stieleria varia]
MAEKKLTRRQRLRIKQSFPMGMYVGLLTGTFVTLVGVALRLEPFVIFVRSFSSSVLLGSVVSIGLSIVKMADTEYKQRHTVVQRR